MWSSISTWSASTEPGNADGPGRRLHIWRSGPLGNQRPHAPIADTRVPWRNRSRAGILLAVDDAAAGFLEYRSRAARATVIGIATFLIGGALIPLTGAFGASISIFGALASVFGAV